VTLGVAGGEMLTVSASDANQASASMQPFLHLQWPPWWLWEMPQQAYG
jgi:hypothetical protein